ncbi:sterol desaturase family protein [Streptomyces sp. H10-C2]|uniref:sterol desaturase family protein n=1 Tax=unclassified Streptomyces TaxID=2593676 RepID=UPI0024BA1A2E|nr:MULTISPECIES: sterol desaturase family protein [unclassified Streptomyces]MDJ0344692.1 sterol desaturase family protein [Streptomyces sp. PH10-H1]MDJ0372824.1 sterol desaturase family protein [Streptomyces sp. H10-C2]
MDLDKPAKPLLTYGTYPTLALITAAGIWAALRQSVDRSTVIGLLILATFVIAFAVERMNPLLDRWSMTKRSLLDRDLPFIGLAVVVDQIATAGVSLIATAFMPAGGFGPLGRMPLAAQAVSALLALDLLWYAYHRAAHTFTRMWRVHGLHHSPSQLYVLMHQVFHPLDLLVSRFVIALVVFRFSGIEPDAAFIAIVVLGLQQTVSHMNSDLRTGWLNYLLIGTETHRYHHASGERRNYGSVVPLWDILFNTFVYEPRRIPDELGLDDPTAYPDPRRFHTALAWPFRRATT